MDIGIGLPVLCPAPEMPVTAWARRAEERGFTSLGAIDRLVYDSYEPFTELAVAAGATSRIRLTTVVCWLRCAPTTRCSLSLRPRWTVSAAAGSS